jgi:hypothetical protein
MYTSIHNSSEQIKQDLRQKIAVILQVAKELPPEVCCDWVRTKLLSLQKHCQMIGKVFIVVEEKITCDCYELGGSHEHAATLFRGPDENASVAICVTGCGSLIYRNSSPWIVHRNFGDINPTYSMNAAINTNADSLLAAEHMSSSMRSFIEMGV